MEEFSFAEELSLFAKDLFADLMSRHPLFWMLPRARGNSPYFTSEISKCVMLQWSEMRNELQSKLRNDFPRFAKTKDSFKQYLKFFVDLLMKRERNPTCQLFLLPAILLEIIGFAHRRGVTHFIRDASDYLLFMFSSVKSDDFYKGGGWNLLASEALKLTKDYDEHEICRQYLSANVCSFGASTASDKIRSPLGNFSKTSREISKETSQAGMEFVHEASTEGVKISAEKRVSILQNPEYVVVKALSLERSEIDLREERVVILPTAPSTPDTKNLAARKERTYKRDRSSLFPWTEHRRIVSGSAEAAEKESQIEGCSFQRPLELETSLTTSESTEDFIESSIKRKMLDHGEPSEHNIGKSIAEYKDSAKESKESKGRKAEIDHLSSQSSIKVGLPLEDFSEISKEISAKTFHVVKIVHEDQTEGIKNQTEKNVSTLENQESIEVKTQSPIQSKKDISKEPLVILPIESFTPKTKNIAVECAKGYEIIEGNVIPKLPETGVGHIVSESAKACEKESLIKDCSFQTQLEPVKGNDSNIKSPKPEANNRLTPVEDPETPSSDKHDAAVVKAQTPKSESVKNVTPNKDETLKSSPLVSDNNKMDKFHKRVKSHPRGNKPDSPRNLLKAPTDHVPPKIGPKSSDKAGSSKSSVRKPTEIPKSSKSASELATETGIKDRPTTTGSGVKSKIKIAPLNLPKVSASTTSKPVTKHQTGAGNAKKAQSSNAAAGSVKKSTVDEKSVESSTDKSTDAFESEDRVDSKDDLDTSLDITKDSPQSGKKPKKPGVPSSSARNTNAGKRNRNVSDKKGTEKPRWMR